MRLSLLMCTYERPALLREALDAISRLEGLTGTDLEMVVVDNSNGGTARATVEDVARAFPFPLRYAQAHPPNISVARNAAVARASGDVIAFLDDDSRVEPGWLKGVLDGIARLPHDILLGPIFPRFEDPALASPHAVSLFERELDAPSGTDLRVGGPKRTRNFVIATGNSIFRRHVFTDAEPFDPALGDAGGEDYDFFFRLERRGARLGYLAEAKVSEFVPARRCTNEYLARRHYAGAQAFAFCVVKNSPHPRLAALELRAKALVQYGGYLLARGKMDEATRRIRHASITGKLTWTSLTPLYRMEDNAGAPKAGAPPA